MRELETKQQLNRTAGLGFAKLVSMLGLLGSLCSATLAGGLEGKITDSENGQPLPGASVIVSGTGLGAATDIDGYYRIDNLPQGTYRIKIHLIGYEKAARAASIQEAGMTKLDVGLKLSPWKLDEIVVTATRRKHILKDVPVTTELITREEMASTGALTVAQALDSHIGVTVDDDLSGKGITLRGVDPSRILILIDGRRVIGRVRGSLDLGQISLSNVDRIEIVKGAGSTLYGSEAIGGVVNIITSKPRLAARLRSSLEYGSFNTLDPEFQVEGGLKDFSLLLTGKYERTDGFDLLKDTPHTNGLEQIKRSNLGGKIVYRPNGPASGELSIGYMQESKRWIESEWFEPLQKTFVYDDYEWNHRFDVGLTGKYIVSPKTDVEVSLYGSLYDHDWSKYTSAAILDDSSVTEDRIFEASIQANHLFSEQAIVTLGGDLSSASLKSTQIVDGAKSVTFGDAFLQFELVPLRSLTILPGIRWERHQTFGNHINPSFNVMWAPHDRFALRGSVGRGFRAPSVKEIYFIFDHSAAGYIVYGGGDGLDPETSNNYSLTAEFNYDRRGLHRLTLFRNDLNNLIDFDLIEFTPTYWRGVYRYLNIVEARTEGLEWESKVKVCTGWDLSFSYAYLKAHNLTEGIELINRPQHTVKFTSVFTVPAWNAGLTFWGTYHDRKLWTSQADTPDRLSDVFAPKRVVLNINLYKKFSSAVEGYFRVGNVTNEINGQFGYWPPRSYTVGLRVNFFNGASGSKE